MNRRTLLAVIAITLTAACDQATSPVAPSSLPSDAVSVVGPPTPAFTYSGRATAVDASIGLLSIKKCDTGPLPPSGGSINNSWPSLVVPGVINFGLLYCQTHGGNGVAATEAGIAHLNLWVGGHAIYADLLPSMARAECNQERAAVIGHAHIVRLIIDGKQTAITGGPNQKIWLPNGYIVINEQTKTVTANSAAITVVALRVVISGVLKPLADVKLSRSHADIRCTFV